MSNVSRWLVCAFSVLALAGMTVGCTGQDRRVPDDDNGDEETRQDSGPNEQPEDVGDSEPDTTPEDSGGGDNEDAGQDTGGGQQDTGQVSIPGPDRCILECSTAQDCASEQGGQDGDWVCANGLCKPTQCTSDDDCQPFFWTNEGCGEGDCDFGNQVCVEYEGTTWCAQQPDGGSCQVPFEEQRDLTAAGGGTVTVCLGEMQCQWDRCFPVGVSCEQRGCSGGGTCNDQDACGCSAGDCNDGYSCWTGSSSQ